MERKLAIKGGRRTVDENLKIKWPVISEEDKKAVVEVLDSGTVFGPYAPQMVMLQEEFAKFVGTKYCIAMNSGTATLHAAVAAAGVGPGDEVITPAFSFLASATCIMHHNAIPVFVDIDPVTYDIDVNKIEEKITDKTKAIIPVHIHGLPADMDPIMEIARKHNLIVIEDAAQAQGAQYKGKTVGSIGHMAGFSMNATKNHCGGEGGLFVTNSAEYRGKANMVRMFGEFVNPDEGRKYKAYTMGWMYRINELTAAFARSQLKRLPEFNANAQRNGNYLTRELSKIKGVKPPVTPEGRTHVYHKYRIRLVPEELGLDIEPVKFRDAVQKALQAEGVDAVLWQTMPVPAQPLFQLKEGYGKGCPFRCPFYGKEIEYRTEDYPETVKLIESSLVICSEPYPIFPQKMELMELYVEAFHKVFDDIDQLLD